MPAPVVIAGTGVALFNAVRAGVMIYDIHRRKELGEKRMLDSKEPNWKRQWLTSVSKTPGRLWLLLLIVIWAMSQNNQTIIEDIITILIV